VLFIKFIRGSPESFRIVRYRQDLNNPPTAVGGIRLRYFSDPASGISKQETLWASQYHFESYKRLQ
jgi:hypothetical protein